MIFNLFRRTPRDIDTIASLYGTIVAQARAPVFYQNYGVPDTVNGRFEMIVLHAVLLLHRLNAASDPIRRLGQAIFDMFCSDMDGNLRELGVGDLAVPRTMRRIGEAFYGRQQAYEAALAAPEVQQLAAALARNVFGMSEPGAGAERLAAYAREAVRDLTAQDETALSRADIRFPVPETIPDRDRATAERGDG
jgi:cytochrome b pre-mRNA-processing protein 3